MYVAEATESELALAARTLEYIESSRLRICMLYEKREREREKCIHIYRRVSECLCARRTETMSAKGDRTWEHGYNCISSELIM